MQRKLFDVLPDNFKKCCNKDRVIEKETLTSTSIWKEREVYIFSCVNPKCKSMKAVKINTNRNDEPVIQYIEKTKEVKREKEFVEQEKVKVKNYRQQKPDNALGYTCIDGKEAITKDNHQTCPIRRLSNHHKVDDFETDFKPETRPEEKRYKPEFIRIA